MDSAGWIYIFVPLSLPSLSNCVCVYIIKEKEAINLRGGKEKRKEKGEVMQLYFNKNVL